MTRDVEALRAEYATLRAAADSACRDAQAAQEAAKFAYSSRLGPCADAVRRQELALARWWAADDAANRARLAVIEAEDEIARPCLQDAPEHRHSEGGYAGEGVA